MTLFSRFSAKGLTPERALSKLHRNGISVYNVSKPSKDKLYFSVKRRDEAKVFAIFEDSCYNIGREPPRGWSGLLARAKSALWLLVGAALAFTLLFFLRPLVLRIEVHGAGRQEGKIRALLAEQGVSPLKAYRGASGAPILALSDVSFCSFRKEGFVLHVEIGLRPADGVRAEPKALVSDCEGIVESVIVLSGTPAISVGDTVSVGTVLVEPIDRFGREAVPSAKVCIRCEARGSYAELLLLTGGEYLSLEADGDAYRAVYRRILSLYFT